MTTFLEKRIERIVILTGAGVSAESGLTTFRDSGGLWEGYDPLDIATPTALETNRDVVLDFYNLRRSDLNKCLPNRSHLAISHFQRAFSGHVFLITQNVDDLHERAGSPQVLHMHGSLKVMRCEHCYKEMKALQIFKSSTPCPLCLKSGNLRPDIVFFGEIPKQLDEINVEIMKADLFVSIGTSGVVYPAAGFAAQARDNEAICVEINKEKSEIANLFDYSHIGLATVEVPKFFSKVLLEN